MSSHRKPLSGEQAKARLRSQGITTTQWAEARGYSRREVYRVLNGQLKANFGTAHKIAIELGMKIPETDAAQSTEPAAPRNTHERRAA